MRLHAACLAGCIVLAPAVVHAQDNLAYARQHFQRGTELFTAQRFDDALDAFRTSQTLYASPNTRLFIARCLRETAHLADAVTEYERAVGEANERAATDPRYAETRASAEAELHALEPRIGRLRVELPHPPPGTRFFVDGHELPVAALNLTLPVMPGSTHVRIEAPGVDPFSREVSIQAGTMSPIAVTLNVADTHSDAAVAPRPSRIAVRVVRPPSPHDARPILRALGWTGLALGVAGFASMGVFFALASNQDTTLATCEQAVTCGPTDGPIATGYLYQGLTNASLAVGVTGAVAGTALLLAGVLAPSRRATVAVGPGSLQVAF